MSQKKLSVSVIMPVYNGAGFLEEALSNLQKQDYAPLEIILVDDGSTDESAAIAARFAPEVRYTYQPNQGPAAARNTGLGLATGEVIAFLDVDDLWPDDRLLTQTKYLVEHPSVEVVQGLIQDLRRPDTEAGKENSFQAVAEPYYSVNLGGAIYRREAFNTVGPFDETLRYNEDTDWFIRAWDRNVNKMQIPEVALYYRKHAGNMTRADNSKYSGLVRLLKKRLDHQRALGKDASPPAAGQLRSITQYIGWTD